MIHTYKLLTALALCALILTNCSQPQATSQAVEAPHQQEQVWPALQKEHRPWTRWWWMGSAVDEQNISRLLEAYASVGLGGVEIAPIYGAKGYESRYIDFLSPEWMHMLDFTVKKAGESGMGVDMTQGTGWPYGGPQVTPAYAASKLLVQTYTLKGGQQLQEELEVQDPKQGDLEPALLALTAYSDEGKILNLLDKVNAEGKLNWRPAAGDWTIYAAFNGKTRQKVKRAAPGGVGYTLDHLSGDAADVYFARFQKAFNGDKHGVRAFYNDSYEVYGADWSADFFNEFETRRGYDLRRYLRELLSEEASETVARLKADYRQTMSEMLLENFTRRWSGWAHGQGSITKNQAHGSPGNLLDLYAAVDIPEVETFGSSYFPIPGLRRDSADIRNVDPDPIMLKFGSSAAHVTGKKLTSCETFTWLGEHFKTSFSQMKPEVEQVFLAGVNHVFYHGVTYSPEDVPWPGWLFYASLNLTPANSLWPHFSGINNYIARCQSILQTGKSDNEVLVYWPVHDVWNDAEGRLRMLTVHGIDKWLHPTPFYEQVKQLTGQGYSLDFVSDALLSGAKGQGGRISTSPAAAPYQVLVIPQTDFMPPATLEHALRLAREGATVVLEELPSDVPGLSQLEPKKEKLQQLTRSLQFTDRGDGIKQAATGKGQVLLAKDVQRALAFANIHREALTDTGLKFIRRQTEGGKYYYLVNHTAKAIDQVIPLNMKASSVTIMDPQSTQAGLAAFTTGHDRTQVRVQLQPGEALILWASTNAKAPVATAWAYLEKAGAPIAVQGEWTLRFTEGGPELPAAQKLTELVSWTALPDPKATAFSGSGAYTVTFELPSRKAAEYVLDLGQVHESARVWVNGQEVGLLWGIPFRARIGAHLKPGRNTLKIEVANLMANRIRDMDRKGISWRNYHEINFVNINYKPFDASGWQPMPSGLLGPVTITPHSTTAGLGRNL
ncbi:glycosyl hydrolase [Pontibacter korlensis]|uniref:Glycoside hydrolase n=1 Tax=Pontibacter korlensis TaxID=400092 RepID=A0A0E3UZI4_9BACT|nr:glycosyl hydrolase [Pontibacter korlensis]AKD05391.1 glycoside hydrolase [Pontibacter korlensis]